MNVTHLIIAEAAAVVATTVEETEIATAAENLGTSLETVLMGAVEAEVLVDTEVATGNATVAELLGIFLEIAQILTVATKMNLTIVNLQENIFGLARVVDLSCHPQIGGFFRHLFVVSNYATRTGLLNTQW